MRFHRHFLTFLFLGSSLIAQESRHWDWIAEARLGVKDSDEILGYYHSHRAAFENSWASPASRSVKACDAFALAKAAYLLRDPEFPILLQKASGIADGLAARIAREPGIDVSDVTGCHIALISSCCQQGDFLLARQLADEAVSRFESIPKDRVGMVVFHPGTIIATTLGDYAAAERQMLDSLQRSTLIDEQVSQSLSGGMKAPRISTFSLAALAHAQAGGGKFEEAKASLTKFQVQFFEDKPIWDLLLGQTLGSAQELAIGTQKLTEAVAWTIVSGAWLSLKEPGNGLAAVDHAENAFEEVTRLSRKFLSDANSRVDPRIKALATILGQEQNRELKELARLRAICLLQLGRHGEAADLFTRQIEERAGDLHLHPDTVAARRDLCWTQIMAGDTAAAQATALRQAEEQIEMTGRLLDFASEQQRMSYLQQADPFSLLVATGQTEALISSIIRLKGIVLDSSLEEKRLASQSLNGEAHQVRMQLQGARQRLAEATMSGSPKIAEAHASLESVELRFTTLLGQQVRVREGLSATTRQIENALQPSDALLEFIRYRHMAEPGKWEPHYGAATLRSGSPGTWTPLGPCDPIDATIGKLIDELSGAVKAPEDSELEQSLRSLFDNLLTPLESHLEGVRRVIIGPDGNLSRLSFAVLLAPDGRFAMEAWDLTYVSTARDLLREATPLPPGGSEMLLVADPVFDLQIPDSGASKLPSSFVSFDREALVDLPSLPGTARELAILRSVAESQGIKISVLTGSAASEAPLRASAVSCAYLHIATHGLVLPPAKVVAAAERGQGFSPGEGSTAAIPGAPPMASLSSLADNPLQRSILALSGANTTFRRWRKGEFPPAHEDGVLTAAEIATLDLEKTWLAVLSACETGSGEALSGEGVMGMRRGFFLSGVDHLLMTFWPIADEETVSLMEAFYRDLPQSGHPALSLVTMQREALRRFREEHGLFKAVALAGPFAVSFTGPLPPP